MRALLLPLHTLLSTIPLSIQCIALSTLFLGWFGGHLALEYAAMLKRPVVFSAWLAWLCAPLTALLLLVLLVDALLTTDYGKLQLLGILAVVLLLVSWISQHVWRATARTYLYTAGHTDPRLNTTLAQTQKTRDS